MNKYLDLAWELRKNKQTESLELDSDIDIDRIWSN